MFSRYLLAGRNLAPSPAAKSLQHFNIFSALATGLAFHKNQAQARISEVAAVQLESHVSTERTVKAHRFGLSSPRVFVCGHLSGNIMKRNLKTLTRYSAGKPSTDIRGGSVASATATIIIAVGLLSARSIRAQTAPTAANPLPSFEVASIRQNRSEDGRFKIQLPPGRFVATDVSVHFLIEWAYNVKDYQISGGPKWVTAEKYDVDAKMEDTPATETKVLNLDQLAEQRRLMLQSLLSDRFKLKLIQQTKELPVYVLVIAKNGPKLQESKAGETHPNGQLGGPGMMRMQRGQLTGQGLPISNLVRLLSEQLGRTVLDRTGLTGDYDFTLQWAPEGSAPLAMVPEGGRPETVRTPLPESSGPSIFTAVQEQLGLKLKPQRGPVETLVIEQVERPSEN